MDKTKPKARPEKPYPSFPLTPHPNGQWCKKIRGHVRFFGVWADPMAALGDYNRQASDLHAGRTPRDADASSTLMIKDIGNHFLAMQKEKAERGLITPAWFDDCLFRTWADETHDQHAIHRIMGHAIPGMSGVYVQEIGLDRLRAAVDHVRAKLFVSQ